MNKPTSSDTAKSKTPVILKVLDRPQEMKPQYAEHLAGAFAEISARATGGKDWQVYSPGQDGWRDYYASPGGRPRDYARLVVGYAGERVVHFTALDVLQIGGYDVIWFHIAITEPEFQGAGVLLKAVAALLDPMWMERFSSTVHVVFRTPNPIVYESLQAIPPPLRWRIVGRYPEIKETGLPEAPEEIRSFAKAVAARLSPECPYDSERFVIKGYFKKYGALYQNLNFPCRNPVTSSFFKQQLDELNQDGLLTISLLEREY